MNVYVPYRIGQVIPPEIAAGDRESEICRVPVMNHIPGCGRLNKWVNWQLIFSLSVRDRVVVVADSDQILKKDDLVAMLEKLHAGADIVILTEIGHPVWCVRRDFWGAHVMTYAGPDNCSFCAWFRELEKNGFKIERVGRKLDTIPRDRDLRPPRH